MPATCVPADVLGLRKGRLLPGCDADIVLLDSELKPALTLVKGEIAFERDLTAPERISMGMLKEMG